MSTLVDITKNVDTQNASIQKSQENQSKKVVCDIDVSKQQNAEENTQNIKLQKHKENTKYMKLQKTEENTKILKNEEPPICLKHRKRRESAEIFLTDSDSNDTKNDTHHDNSNKKKKHSRNPPTRNIITNVSQKFNNNESEKANSLLKEDSLLTENPHLSVALESFKNKGKSPRDKTLTSAKLSLRSKGKINLSEVIYFMIFLLCIFCFYSCIFMIFTFDISRFYDGIYFHLNILFQNYFSG